MAFGVEMYKADPASLLQHISYFILVLIALLFAFSIFTCYVYSSHDNRSNEGMGFAAIWSTIMAISLAIFTQLAFNNYKTHFSVGLAIGATFMMSEFFFMIGILFADYAADFDKRRLEAATDEQLDTANEMMAVISFFLFFAYGGFFVAQVRNRQAVMTEETPIEETPTDSSVQ